MGHIDGVDCAFLIFATFTLCAVAKFTHSLRIDLIVNNEPRECREYLKGFKRRLLGLMFLQVCMLLYVLTSVASTPFITRDTIASIAETDSFDPCAASLNLTYVREFCHVAKSDLYRNVDLTSLLDCDDGGYKEYIPAAAEPEHRPAPFTISERLPCMAGTPRSSTRASRARTSTRS